MLIKFNDLQTIFDGGKAKAFELTYQKLLPKRYWNINKIRLVLFHFIS